MDDMAATDDDHILNFLHRYDIRNFSEISDDLLCSICGKVMVNACFGPCSCQYCAGCIKTFLDESQERKCPGQSDDCRRFILDYDSDINADIRTDHKIKKLKVKCPKVSGCKVEDTVAHMAVHVTTCGFVMNKCPYFAIGCNFESVDTCGIEKHLLTEGVNHSKILIESVINVRNQMDSWQSGQPHGDQINQLTDTVDRLQTQNSRMSMRIVELESVVESLQREMSEMRQRFKATDDESLPAVKSHHLDVEIFGCDASSDDRNAVEQGEAVVAAVDRLSCSIECVVCQSADNTDILSRLEAVSSELSEIRTIRVADAQGAQNTQMSIGQRLDDLDARMGYFEQEMQTCLKKFVWKVEQLGKLRRDALNRNGCYHDSDPFYSHRKGYKMRLFVQIDNAIHVCIGFQMMRGEYDDVLPWPFKGRIVISALSQITGADIVTNSYHYDATPNNCRNSFYKPRHDVNTGYGNFGFLNWEEIRLKKDVYRNDCIYLRCVILR